MITPNTFKLHLILLLMAHCSSSLSLDNKLSLSFIKLGREAVPYFAPDLLAFVTESHFASIVVTIVHPLFTS